MSADKQRSQVTITLSPKALEEFEEVAEWLGMPLGTLLRQKLEEAHQSPNFGNLVKRAKGYFDKAKDE